MVRHVWVSLNCVGAAVSIYRHSIVIFQKQYLITCLNDWIMLPFLLTQHSYEMNKITLGMIIQLYWSSRKRFVRSFVRLFGQGFYCLDNRQIDRLIDFLRYCFNDINQWCTKSSMYVTPVRMPKIVKTCTLIVLFICQIFQMSYCSNPNSARNHHQGYLMVCIEFSLLKFYRRKFTDSSRLISKSCSGSFERFLANTVEHPESAHAHKACLSKKHTYRSPMKVSVVILILAKRLLHYRALFGSNLSLALLWSSIVNEIPRVYQGIFPNQGVLTGVM